GCLHYLLSRGVTYGARCCGLVVTGFSPESDVQTIPAINGGDGKREIRDFRFTELPANLLEYRVWNVTFSHQRYGFGPGQSCPFAFGVKRCFRPGVELIQSLLALSAGSAVLPVHVNAVSTTIDLGRPKSYQV